MSATAQRELPAEQRHYVRVLFNGQELTVRTHPGRGVKDITGTVYECNGGEGQCECLPEALTLQQFQEEVLSTFALTEEQHQQRCQLPAGIWDFLMFGGATKEAKKEDMSKY